MMRLLRSVLLVVGYCLTIRLAVAQENSAPDYVQQGLQYERAENYRKALQAYRNARPLAIPADQKLIDKAIDRVEDLIQQQTLVNQARNDNLLRTIQTLSDVSIRRRLQDELTALEKSGTASPADFQRLVRRVDAAKRVDTALSSDRTTRPVSRPPEPARPEPTPPRPDARPSALPVAATPPVQKPTTPPKKAVTVGMPGVDAGVFRGSQKSKTIRKPKLPKP